MNKVKFSLILKELSAEVSEYRRNIFRTLILGMVCGSSNKCISSIWNRFSFIFNGESTTRRRFYEFLDSPNIPWKRLRMACLRMLGNDILTDGRLLAVLDDSTYGKSGKKISGAARHFDHAAKQNSSKNIWGHCRVVCGILTSIKGRWAFLPWLQDNFVPVKQVKQGEKKTKIDIAVNQIIQIVEDFKSQKILLVCDSWFGVSTLVKQVVNENGLHILSRLRKNAGLYEVDVEQSEGRGRKRKYGKRIQSLMALADELKPTAKTAKIHIYSKLKDVTYSEKIVMSKALGRTIKVIFIYSKNGKFFPLFTTDLTLCAKKCIEYYGARWKIEAGFKELKRELGALDNQARNEHAVENHFNLACLAMTATWIYALKQDVAPKKRISAAKHFSFADIRAQIENEFIEETGFFNGVCPNSIKLAGKYILNKLFSRVA